MNLHMIYQSEETVRVQPQDTDVEALIKTLSPDAPDASETEIAELLAILGPESKAPRPKARPQPPGAPAEQGSAPAIASRSAAICTRVDLVRGRFPKSVRFPRDRVSCPSTDKLDLPSRITATES